MGVSCLQPEIRISKSETNPKFETQLFQTNQSGRTGELAYLLFKLVQTVLPCFGHLEFGHLNLFRISIFGFLEGIFAQNLSFTSMGW